MYEIYGGKWRLLDKDKRKELEHQIETLEKELEIKRDLIKADDVEKITLTLSDKKV